MKQDFQNNFPVNKSVFKTLRGDMTYGLLQIGLFYTFHNWHQNVKLRLRVNEVYNVSIKIKEIFVTGGSETSYSRHLVLIGEQLGVR